MTASLPRIPLFRAICLTAGLASLTGNAAWACSVPVFRYALERFPADAYHLVVYYRGSLSGEAKAAVDALERLSNESGPAPNVELKTIDLDALPKPAVATDAKPERERDSEKKSTEAAKPAWTPPASAKLPWLAVTLPGDDSAPLWSAPLNVQDLPRLFDSPARREIVKRLIKGETAVFVLLESGRKEEDAKAVKQLTTTIAKMQKDLELPADDGTGRLQSELPVRIAFSVLAVRRGDPAEGLLIKFMETALAQSNPEKKQDGVSIVCPIFGRGHVLTAFAGKDLTEERIEEVGQFLCGACSCSLKGQLPGADLLLTADWDALLENRVVREDPPALRSLGALAEAARAAATPSVVTLPQEPQTDTGFAFSFAVSLPGVIAGTLAAIIGVILIAGGWMWIAMRRRGPT